MWGIGRNLGKKRSKFGKWLDRNGYNQEDLVSEAKVSRNTVSKLCNDPDYIPGPSVMKKVLKAIRKVDPGVKMDDFFDV
jgi:transcriptional regulator with XRE-family HTH domain